MSLPLKLFFALSGLCALITSSSYAIAPKPGAVENHLNSGYSVLKLFLEDEQHLTTIRRIKAIIRFGGISEASTNLVDSIADTSETFLDELEALRPLKPAINFVEFSDGRIGKSTYDSLRMTTAKEFLFDNHSFEKNLLISQAQILRVISHLAAELADKEPEMKRKVLLQQIARQYEDFYMLVYARITLV